MDQYKNPPSGYHTITPYFYVDDAAAAIEFYIKIFAATEIMRFNMPDGKVAHAEIGLGNSRFMLADESQINNTSSPRSIGGTASGLLLYVEDVDTLFAKAVAEGCTPMQQPTDQFYGDRNASFIDPWGHHWSLAKRVENLSFEEMLQRMQKMEEQSKDK